MRHQTNTTNKDKEPLVSIVIPCFNRPDMLQCCIESVFNQHYANVELIVVDDNSSDDLKSILKPFTNGGSRRIVYLKNPRNYYPSYVKNQGILLSTGEYLLFIDSDTEFFQPDAIGTGLAFLTAHPEFAVVGGEAGFDEKGNHISVHGVKFQINPGFTIDIRDHVFKTGAYKDVDVVDTSNMLIRKDILLKSGGFDPGFRYPHEDSDLCYRLRQSGLRIAIHYPCAIIHKRALSHRMNQVYFVSRARIRYQLKHFGLFRSHFYNTFSKSVPDRILGRIPGVYKDLPDTSRIYSTPDFTPTAFQDGKRMPSKSKHILFLLFYIHRAILENLLDYHNIRASRQRKFLDDPDLATTVQTSEIL